jgi:transaldolase
MTTKTDLRTRGSKLHATALLHELGQSLWLDNITRDLLDSGTLNRYIDELSVTGLTSNPTIFEQAIKNSSAYDSDIRTKLNDGKSAEQVFFELAMEDLTRAADLFRPIYDRTNGTDGWVSLEVSPLLAHDTAATVEAAKDLFARANRPNLFIKIPGTREGLPAIEEAIFAGVPVNVTLLFSREQYLGAAEAYLRGIERRIQSGLNPSIRSVASVFVSRWDTAVNGKVPANLRSQLGIAIALRTYKASLEFIKSPRAYRTYSEGAWPQRLLWASTGVKDPMAPPVLYVKNLAAPVTIDTMPEATLMALSRETRLGSVMATDGSIGEQTLAQFARAGIDIDSLADRLQDEGTKSFANSWNSLMAVIAAKGASDEKSRVAA